MHYSLKEVEIKLIVYIIIPVGNLQQIEVNQMIRDKYTSVSRLYSGEVSGGAVRVSGWIRTNRGNRHIGFIELNDGSCFKGCQIVYDMDKLPELSAAEKFLTGCAVDVTGELVATPDAKQPFEIRAEVIELIGGCDTDFPMQKKRH